MVHLPDILTAHVIWKGRKLFVELSSDASLKELGEELQALTDVKADTIRLIIPQSSSKSSKLFMPFSNEHSYIKLQDTGIGEGKPIRMMGVYEHEVDQLLKDAEANLRIAGFEDEEKRMKQRISRGPQASLKLPQGPYIFCDFRTLEIPGIQLNPLPSEALKRMHMLASDPGIVAIMNKHRWRVGIMTEMAPVGYVGISPKCLLGFNKNHGEEISLRLRTDDLKGFRKYESIKKTLLHELAHMVYSEHDSNFYALDKQLNQEAFALDWTRSRSHSLSDARFSGHDDMDMDLELESSLPQKLGGETSLMAINAREASVVAAYHRLADSSIISQGSSLHEELASDDYAAETRGKSKSVSSGRNRELLTLNNHDSSYHNHEKHEPDPDDSGARDFMNLEPCPAINEGISQVKHSLNATWMGESVPKFTSNGGLGGVKMQEEPDLDDSEFSEIRVAIESHVVDSQSMQFLNNKKSSFKITYEPDPDDLEARRGQPQLTMVHLEPVLDDAGENRMEQAEPDPDDKPEPLPQIMGIMTNEPDPDDLEARCQRQLTTVHVVPDPDDAEENRMEQAEPDPDDKSDPLPQLMGIMTYEPDPDDQELRRIQDPVNVFCNQLTKAIEKLSCDLRQSESKVVLETLFKIMRNVLENPNEMRYRNLRKANPAFQRSVANHKAAMEILFLIGFSEDVVVDETAKSETYITLKRNDPGLLWLAKSTLETYIS